MKMIMLLLKFRVSTTSLYFDKVFFSYCMFFLTDLIPEIVEENDVTSLQSDACENISNGVDPDFFPSKCKLVLFKFLVKYCVCFF